jgi:hypothetical protein
VPEEGTTITVTKPNISLHFSGLLVVATLLNMNLRGIVLCYLYAVEVMLQPCITDSRVAAERSIT